PLENSETPTTPKTPEIPRSAFNAVKHGCTSDTLLLPDEDAHLLQDQADEVFAGYQIDGHDPVEYRLGLDLLKAKRKLGRGEVFALARLAADLIDAPEPRLRATLDPLSADQARLDSDPFVAAHTLTLSTQGCDLLSFQWQALEDALETSGWRTYQT